MITRMNFHVRCGTAEYPWPNIAFCTLEGDKEPSSLKSNSGTTDPADFAVLAQSFCLVSGAT
jgi:hypothetical protein